jgi:flavorubredoxin
MGIELYNDGNHRCIAYRDSCAEHAGSVQSNQFLIIDNGVSALLDPGGELSYADLYMGINNEIMVKDLNLLMLSHQDPDVASSLSKWLASTDCRVYAPHVWARFLPHLCRNNKASVLTNRFESIPDEGMAITLGNCDIVALPAHFLHSDGNFQFYDPVSRILFSGDLGSSINLLEGAGDCVEDFDTHKQFMQGFHRRHMASGKVGKLWANMVRKLNIERIVPQHGAWFEGRDMVNRFIDWVENEECGIDLLTEQQYRAPLFRH